ncbi:glycoside hydrolase family 92 protein [Dothistroma septosporum NZE10]|uniref:Glycoside hydrolase family 92 protein n=1 Tax=Dothistroma septosporum (strain NZE10 / CBS 128990) TaxID=675120 RepID=M2Y3U8_DOTSN|nr:glycoside hydrolase family 92 protein [Dothistroma septosporum NZE10]
MVLLETSSAHRGKSGTLLLLCLSHLANAQTIDVKQSLSLVDPLIGSYNGGNVFAGATLPFGMAKAVADVSGQNTAGFSYDFSNVTGFSALHNSGTGGQPDMGLFPVSVQPSCAGDTIEGCTFGSKYGRAVNYVNGSVVAKPGLFSLDLENGVKARMSTTQHTALYEFTMPANGSSPLFLLDLTDLQDSRQNASISVNQETGRMSGNGTFLPSFGVGSYQAYFCADFRGASVQDTGVWVNGRAGTQPKELFVNRGYSLFYIQAGGFVRLQKPENGKIQARMGVSFFSTEQACRSAELEIPDGLSGSTWDFDKVANDAEDAWKQKLAGVAIEPGGASQDLQKTFFTGIYRTMISPQNYTSENPLWQSSEPYFDSFYCIWDSFRTDFPFLTITQPEALSEMLRSLIDTYAHEGWLPDCRMQLSKGYSQGGSNADVVLADAYVKNLTGVDWNHAYEAVVNDAENEPFDWGVNGRGGLQSWKRLGYIPVDDYDYLGFGPNFHSISRSLEYSYNDFCIASIAHGLEHDSDYEKYLERGANWQNLYKANQSSTWPNGTMIGNFTGFFQPRYSNGTWGYQNPFECSPLDDKFCSYSSNPRETFESAIWEYQFYVPQDQATLISILGGPSEFVRRLDYLHESGLLDIGNEPSELTALQYHYAGRPGRSAYRLHTYIPSCFNASINGLSGNDDSGASGSFIAFAMSGLFPVAGQNVYLITPPFFESVSYVHPQTGKVATIRNIQFDPTYEAIYIQNATLNGKTYSRSWIGHEFFLDGGVLELTLGREESAWGTEQGDLPPSAHAGAGGKYRATL